jgi:ABC-type hemin transport system substrate-binding protein
MKIRKEGVAVWRLDENRYAISLDQVVRYVGSQAECERRADILVQRTSRDVQDAALARACRIC